jgi:hypothetical protein
MNIKTPVVLSLLLTLAAGTPLATLAEDESPTPTPKTTAPAIVAPTTPATPTTPPAPKKPLHQTLTGRVVAIDRFQRSVTLQVGNLTYVLQITDSTRVMRSEKEQTMADFVIGEEISVNVILRELANGRIEVAVILVNLPEFSDAQGGKGKGRGANGTFTTPPPFLNGPNPGNVDGPVISRNR